MGKLSFSSYTPKVENFEIWTLGEQCIYQLDQKAAYILPGFELEYRICQFICSSFLTLQDEVKMIYIFEKERVKIAPMEEKIRNIRHVFQLAFGFKTSSFLLDKYRKINPLEVDERLGFVTSLQNLLHINPMISTFFKIENDEIKLQDIFNDFPTNLPNRIPSWEKPTLNLAIGPQEWTLNLFEQQKKDFFLQ